MGQFDDFFVCIFGSDATKQGYIAIVVQQIGQRLITEETKKEMKKVLTEIQDGTFARNWLLENQSGCVHFLAKRRIEAGSQLEEVGKDLRSKMSWGTKVEEL